MLCYAMICYVMLSYAMLCYAVLCNVMLCYVIMCHVMLGYVILLYDMSYAYHSNTRAMKKNRPLKIISQYTPVIRENILHWFRSSH